MTLERKTLRAEGILAGRDIAVGKKLSALTSAYGALLALAQIEESEHRHSPLGHALQHGTGKEV
jgi:hypothetical protein